MNLQRPAAAAVLITLLAAFTCAEPPTTQPANAALPQEPGQILEFLQSKLEAVKTVQADFHQTKQLKMFERELVLTGRLALQKPNRMAWHVDTPIRYTMLMTDKRVQQWDAESNQVHTLDIDNEPAAKVVFRQVPAWLEGDFKTIAKEYDADVTSRSPLVIGFKPKTGSPMNQAIRHVTVTIGDDLQSIQRLRIEEAAGDITNIVFTKTVLNQPIPKKSLEIPPK